MSYLLFKVELHSRNKLLPSENYCQNLSLPSTHRWRTLSYCISFIHSGHLCAERSICTHCSQVPNRCISFQSLWAGFQLNLSGTHPLHHKDWSLGGTEDEASTSSKRWYLEVCPYKIKLHPWRCQDASGDLGVGNIIERTLFLFSSKMYYVSYLY